MFAYCNNNPIKNADPQGTFVNTITGAIVGGIIGAISAYASGDDVWAGAVIGAGTGALAGLAADFAIATGGVGAVIIAAAGGAVSSGVNYAATQLVNDRSIDITELAVESTVGAVANLLTFGAGGGSLAKVGGKAGQNMVKNFTNTFLKNTTKTVAGKTVFKTTKTVFKHVAKNSFWATAETAAISCGAYWNAQLWKVVAK